MRLRRSVAPNYSNAPVGFVRTQQEYEAILADAAHVFAIPAQVPDWVFRQTSGTVSFCEEGEALWNLVPIFTSLIEYYGDRTVSAVAKDFTNRRPSMRRIYDGRFKAFTTPTGEGASSLGPLLECDPFGYGISTFQYEDIVMVFGDSGQWGLYRDMGWELGLLWVNTDEPFWPQLPGHYLTNARGATDIARPAFFDSRSFEGEAQRLIYTYSSHDPWRNSPALARLDLKTCVNWLVEIHRQDPTHWAYVQRIIWSYAVWDLPVDIARKSQTVDPQAFDLLAVTTWFEDRHAAGPEPWLEAKAMVLDLMAEMNNSD